MTNPFRMAAGGVVYVFGAATETHPVARPLAVGAAVAVAPVVAMAAFGASLLGNLYQAVKK